MPSKTFKDTVRDTLIGDIPVDQDVQLPMDGSSRAVGLSICAAGALVFVICVGVAIWKSCVAA